MMATCDHCSSEVDTDGDDMAEYHDPVTGHTFVECGPCRDNPYGTRPAQKVSDSR